jgi:hypothetical protein
VARMLGHKSPVVTLEKYKRFGPNLTHLRQQEKSSIVITAC